MKRPEDEVPPMEYGYQDQLAYCYICSTCFHLYERGRRDNENQRCKCQPAEETKWPIRDFNERAILCRCCGLNVLPSGCRWDPYFCRECQLLAMGVSVWNRRLVCQLLPRDTTECFHLRLGGRLSGIILCLLVRFFEYLQFLLDIRWRTWGPPTYTPRLATEHYAPIPKTQSLFLMNEWIPFRLRRAVALYLDHGVGPHPLKPFVRSDRHEAKKVKLPFREAPPNDQSC
jgi:hypothetical protein